MKTINRSMIKGQKLDDDCVTARVCTEFYKDTKYCFCYGIVDLHYDEFLDKCKNCKACVRNMPSWKEDFETVGRK